MSRRRRNPLQIGSWIATILTAAATACGGSPTATPDGATPDGATPDAAPTPDAAASYAATVLQTLPYTSGTRTWTIQLVRVDRPDGGRTYIEWIPADTAGARPTMVLTQPYTGIDWSGEPIDAQWAASSPLANGFYLDVNGPMFDGSNEIVYYPETPAESATDATIQLVNGFAVVEIFGRYYAGGSVREYVADEAAGMWFVAQQAQVDHSRIGVFGASWGGFEGLWAAQQADPSARPAAIAVGFPVSDFATEVAHASSREQPARAFFDSYLHRIAAGTANGTDYTGLASSDLCASLPSSTLVLHDESDDLVPVGETQALVATCSTVTPMYWDRTAAVDPSVISHGLIADEAAPQAYTTFATVYTGLRILAPDQPGLVELYSPADLLAQLAITHTAQLAHRDVGFEAPRLLELADPRVGLVDADTCTATSCPIAAGAAVVAGLVNQTWGTSFTATTIAAQLQIGLPAP